MKTIITAILLLAAGAANAAVPVQIVSAHATGTSLTIAFTAANVTPGNTLVLEVFTATSAPTSVTESLSETVTNRIAWAGNSLVKLAAYDVLNSAGNAKVGFTVNVASSQNIVAILAEYAAASAGAFDQATAVNQSGGSSSVSTASLTPAVSGEVAIGILGVYAGGYVVSSWGNGFADEINLGAPGGTSPVISLADQTLSSTASISVAATLNSTYNWSAAELLYKPSGGLTCTHPGITQAGAFAVPVAGSTVVRLKNGSFGTVDCSTVSYFQPTVGNFGTGAAAATLLTNDVGTNVLTDDAGANTLTP